MSKKYLRRFVSNIGGNIALTAAMASPVLFGGIAVSADYAIAYNKRVQLQAAADSAALAAARELGLASGNQKHLSAVAKSYMMTNFVGSSGSGTSDNDLKVNTVVSEAETDVLVEVAYTWEPFFAHLIDDTVLPIRVNSRASLAGETSICTLTLDKSSRNSLHLTGRSSIKAQHCAVQANSENTRGLSLASQAKLAASTTCVSGGYGGSPSNYSPRPLTDCPPLADPLASRQLPKGGNCDYQDTKIIGKNVKLKPGVYCGGLFADENANVTLRSGVYVFKSGDLDVGGGSSISGDGVSLYFEEDARLMLRNKTKIDLSAPATGAMAGIIVASSQKNNPDLLFEVQSMNARQFTGLVYMPNNTFKIGDDIDGDGKCDPERTRDGKRKLPKIKLTKDNYGQRKKYDDDDDDDDDDDRGKRTRKNKKYKIKYTDLALEIEYDDVDDGTNDTVGCRASVGQQSDWTAIVARNILVTSGVNLVLNADFNNSSVPVPENDGLIGPRARLAR